MTSSLLVFLPEQHPLLEAVLLDGFGGEVAHLLGPDRQPLALGLEQLGAHLGLLLLPRVLVVRAEGRPDAKEVLGLSVLWAKESLFQGLFSISLDMKSALDLSFPKIRY